MIQNYWDTSNNSQFYASYGGGGDATYWWQANGLYVLADGDIVTSSHNYDTDIDNFISYESGNFYDGYTDDEGWMGLAMLNAWSAGVDQSTALQDAEDLQSNIMSYWQSSSGGIIWATNNTNENVPANGTAVILSAELYSITGDSTYLTDAENIFNWMWNTSTLVYRMVEL